MAATFRIVDGENKAESVQATRVSDDTPHLFIFGLGYVGARLARHMRVQGWRVSGTVRDRARRNGCADVVAFDGRATSVLRAALAGASHVLCSAPPQNGVDPVLAACGDLLTESSARWLGYLSTTGVYGDAAGDWVDEDSPVAPNNARATARVVAETAWRALETPRRVVNVFRLAGIYGPGRSAFDKLRDGTARRIDKPGQVFSRIHVDDIVAVLEAAMARREPGGLYNVCDDAPAPAHEVTAHAAELLGIELPPLEAYADVEDELSPMARSFYADNRRVSNARIRERLGVNLAWPTCEAGLAAILAAERDGD